MKILFKLLSIFSIYIAIYFFGGYLFDAIIPNHSSNTQLSLLLIYGGFIGYILFIVFVTLLQQEGYEQTKQYKPKFTKFIYQFYCVLSMSFIILAFINFTFQDILLYAFIFVMLTLLLDVTRDKILNQENIKKRLYPKKII